MWLPVSKGHVLVMSLPLNALALTGSVFKMVQWGFAKLAMLVPFRLALLLLLRGIGS